MQHQHQIDLQFIQALKTLTVPRRGHSLRRRRAWFADDPATGAAPTETTSPATPSINQPPTQTTPAEAQNTDKSEAVMIPKSRLDEEIGKKKEAQAELDKLRRQLDDQAKAEQNRQRQEDEQKGQFKELYEKEKGSRESADAKVTDLQRQVEELTAYRQHFEDSLKAQLDTLPPHIVVLLNKMTPLEKAAYLKENGDNLTTRRAPNLDAGERHTGSGRVNTRPNPIGRM